MKVPIIISTLLLISISCSKIDSSSMVEKKQFRFNISATMPDFKSNDFETKASIDYVARLSWTKDSDKISVINLTTKKILGGELAATSSGTSTTFSGSLSGTMESGDKLMFIYPSQGNTEEIDFSGITLDFSEQDGSASSKVYIATYGTSTANQVNGEMSVSTSQIQFSFLVAYNYLSLSNLPESQTISNVCIAGIPNKMTIDWDYTNDKIKTTPIVESVTKTYDDGTSETFQSGFITLNLLSASNKNTSSTGQRPLYFTCPSCTSDTGFDKTIQVLLDDGNLAYSASFPANLSRNLGQNYRVIISKFQSDDIDPYTLNIDAVMPQLSGTNAPSRAWVKGDEVAVVNLTKNMIYGSTLEAERAGVATTFSGSIDAGEEGIDSGDELLLIYPAPGNIEDEGMKEFTSLTFDLSSQAGTLNEVPYVMTATTTLRDNLSATLANFEYQTAVSQISITGILDELGSLTEETSSINSENSSTDVEGYGLASGSWDGTTTASITKVEISGSEYDEETDEVTYTKIPTMLIISYDSESDYSVSFETSSTITLTSEQSITSANPNLYIYMASPCIEGSTNSYGIYADIFVQGYSDGPTTGSWNPSKIIPTKGSYKEYTASIDGFWESMEDFPEGGETDEL